MKGATICSEIALCSNLMSGPWLTDGHQVLISLCVCRCLQANAAAADEVHRLKCELVYMRDREEDLKQEVAESKQELQVGVGAQNVV